MKLLGKKAVALLSPLKGFEEGRNPQPNKENVYNAKGAAPAGGEPRSFWEGGGLKTGKKNQGGRKKELKYIKKKKKKIHMKNLEVFKKKKKKTKLEKENKTNLKEAPECGRKEASRPKKGNNRWTL